MKKILSVLAAVLMVVVVSAPAFANQPPKGTEGPDIRVIPPKGTEGPDIRVKANMLVAEVQKPKGTEGPDIRLIPPKGTEGPDIRVKASLLMAEVQKPKSENRPARRVCLATIEQLQASTYQGLCPEVGGGTPCGDTPS